MANVLNTDKQIAIIGALTEGSSIGSIERMTSVHRDTIMRLGVKIGQGCTRMMDTTMRELPCTRLEVYEIWGFVGKKQRSVKNGDSPEVGSVWTWCAIDADTKLVPTFKVGERNLATAKEFMQDVAGRMANRVQLTSDGFYGYAKAVEASFGQDVDYGQIVKVYGSMAFGERRYSTSGVLSSYKTTVTGALDKGLISTSYVERLNATTRLHMRRLTRLTLAFSKKRENFEAAVGLHFAFYNFVKRHNTLRCTPAMAAGVANTSMEHRRLSGGRTVSHIDDLKRVIQDLHGGTATHLESVPVHKQHEGHTVWQGIVEVFDLHGHAKANKAYAWSHETDDPDNPKRHVTVLHVPPVVSPITAVRAAIMQEFYARNAA